MSRIAVRAVFALVVVVVALAAVVAGKVQKSAPAQPAAGGAVAQGAASAGPIGTRVCGEPVLHSPFSYMGASGPYTSGIPGLPTFGAPGSDYPDATAGQVLPPAPRTTRTGSSGRRPCITWRPACTAAASAPARGTCSSVVSRTGSGARSTATTPGGSPST